jgi:hypothetical protein
MVGQGVLDGADRIAGFFGKGQRWLFKMLKAANPPPVHYDPNGNIYALEHELERWIEKLPSHPPGRSGRAPEAGTAAGQ